MSSVYSDINEIKNSTIPNAITTAVDTSKSYTNTAASSLSSSINALSASTQSQLQSVYDSSKSYTETYVEDYISKNVNNSYLPLSGGVMNTYAELRFPDGTSTGAIYISTNKDNVISINNCLTTGGIYLQSENKNKNRNLPTITLNTGTSTSTDSELIITSEGITSKENDGNKVFTTDGGTVNLTEAIEAVLKEKGLIN